MISKLKFKGESNSRKKSKKNAGSKAKSKYKVRRSAPTELSKQEPRATTLGATTFRINNTLKKFRDIDKDDLEAGWSVAATCEDISGPTILLVNGVGLPRALACVDQLITTDDQLELIDVDETVNFNEGNNLEFAAEKEIFRLEPTLTTQVFVSTPLDRLLLSESDQRDPNYGKTFVRIALKSSEDKYLRYDRDTDQLIGDSVTITHDTILTLRRLPDQGYGVWSITLGSDPSLKLVYLAESDKVRVIEDDENVLDDETTGIVMRVQTKNTKLGRQIMEYYDFASQENIADLNNANLQKYQDDKLISEKLLELQKLKIKINEDLISKVQQAVQNGEINEFMVKLKEQRKSDSSRYY
ncbi:BA75_00998T0 [Komagataella pastoris]|uniref:BA75_00998T0 n=1 Tax=Komagataella pastoris TaxID=4922 RepID=A0A1B2J6J2_PICPA|nr:BA75_00998T0 [Komagataella pastoris]